MTSLRIPEGLQHLALRHDASRDALGDVAGRFQPIAPGPALDAYLQAASARRHGWWTTRAQRFLTHFLSDFDANALLGFYPMYLLGTEQLRDLLLDGAERGPRALDVGAGSGDVTEQLRPLFDEVATTERSWGMARRLRRLGYRCHETDVATVGVPDGPWPFITCFNVLDRCPDPRGLVDALVEGLDAGGRLCLTMPLPYRPFYYEGARTPDPSRPLPLTGLDFEAGARALVVRVLEPAGLDVIRLARTPYISGGDARAPAYELDAVVVVASKAAASRPASESRTPGQ